MVEGYTPAGVKLESLFSPSSGGQCTITEVKPSTAPSLDEDPNCPAGSNEVCLRSDSAPRGSLRVSTAGRAVLVVATKPPDAVNEVAEEGARVVAVVKDCS